MMSGSDTPSRAGRLTALATLGVSASLFLAALLGIASIDPAADAAAPARPVPVTESISLAPPAADRDEGDCPWRDGDDGGASAERSGARRTS